MLLRQRYITFHPRNKLSRPPDNHQFITQRCIKLFYSRESVSSVSFALLYLIIVGKPLPPPLKRVVPTMARCVPRRCPNSQTGRRCFAPNVEHATGINSMLPSLSTNIYPAVISASRGFQPLSHRRILLLCRKRDDRASKPLEKGVCIRYTCVDELFARVA